MGRLFRLALFAALGGCTPSNTTPPGPEPVPAPDVSDAYPIVELKFETSSNEWRDAHRRHDPAEFATVRVVGARAKLVDHVLRGEAFLVNDGAEAVTLDNGGGTPAASLWLEFAPEAHIKERPVGSPPSAPPPPPLPVHATLPGHSRVRISGGIALDRYAYPPGKAVDVAWSCAGVPDDSGGRGVWRSVRMPPDGPRGEILPIPPG